MTRFGTITSGLAVALLAWGANPMEAEAQQTQPTMPGLPLRPLPPDGYFIIPIYEGWYDNGDGSITVSFGYLNRNDETVEIPIGENNLIEPAEYSGMQPTVFEAGRKNGVFTVTIPPGGPEVWWTIRSAGEMARTPGRKVGFGYQLENRPLATGEVAPLVYFEEGGEVGQYPAGVMAERVERVRVGETLTLTVHADDPSVRNDRYGDLPDTITVNVLWEKHQGPPGEVEWIRDPSTPPPPAEPERDAPAPDSTAAAAGGAAAGAAAADPDPPADEDEPPPPNEITLPTGGGTALQQVRFSVPGTYLLRGRINPSDAAGGQCCWTHAWVRVEVTE
jgi:hypothetical protein